MPEIKHRKTYNQSHFKRMLTLKLNSESESRVTKKKSLKNDNSDLLIYLIYVNYLSELVAEGSNPENGGSGAKGQITATRLENAHDKLMKKYRG